MRVAPSGPKVARGHFLMNENKGLAKVAPWPRRAFAKDARFYWWPRGPSYGAVGPGPLAPTVHLATGREAATVNQ